jgi:hypothetical protein
MCRTGLRPAQSDRPDGAEGEAMAETSVKRPFEATTVLDDLASLLEERAGAAHVEIACGAVDRGEEARRLVLSGQQAAIVARLLRRTVDRERAE